MSEQFPYRSLYMCFQAGIKDEESHANAKTILLKMGEFFQIQVGNFVVIASQLSGVMIRCCQQDRKGSLAWYLFVWRTLKMCWV